MEEGSSPFKAASQGEGSTHTIGAPAKKRKTRELKPTVSEAVGLACTVCGKDACECPTLVRKMKHHAEAKFEDIDGKPKYWIRFGEGLLTCVHCATFLGKNGVKKARGTNKMAGAGIKTDHLDISDLRGHIGKKGSDHSRAYSARTKMHKGPGPLARPKGLGWPQRARLIVPGPMGGKPIGPWANGTGHQLCHCCTATTAWPDHRHSHITLGCKQ